MSVVVRWLCALWLGLSLLACKNADTGNGDRDRDAGSVGAGHAAPDQQGSAAPGGGGMGDTHQAGQGTANQAGQGTANQAGNYGQPQGGNGAIAGSGTKTPHARVMFQLKGVQ